MTMLGNLPINVLSQPGTLPQQVVPKGWALGGAGVLFTPNAQTYSASITPELSLGNWLTITVTNNTAFTINAPTYNGAALSATNVPLGMLVALTILNASGGAMGAVTFNAVYRNAAGFVVPANNNYVSTVFLCFSATQFLALSNWSTAAAF